MSAVDRTDVLMTLMRQLMQIFETEIEVLREVDLVQIAELAEEKQSLVDVYLVELRELRAAPDMMGALEPATREELETLMRAFQESAHRNARALRASQLVVERVAELLRDGVREAAAYGAAGGRVRDPQVIPVAFDQRC